MRIKILSTMKLVQQTVKAFQARSLKEIAQTKDQIPPETLYDADDSIFNNPNDKKVDWSTLINDKSRSYFFKKVFNFNIQTFFIADRSS